MKKVSFADILNIRNNCKEGYIDLVIRRGMIMRKYRKYIRKKRIIRLLLVLGMLWLFDYVIYVPVVTDGIYCIKVAVLDASIGVKYLFLESLATDEDIYMNDIAPQIVSAFEKDGGKICYLSQEEIENTYSSNETDQSAIGEITGFYRSSEQAIYISEANSPFTDYRTEAHEFSHYVIHAYNYGNDELFKEIAEREMNRVATYNGYVASSIEEYKAETLAVYMTNPVMLKYAAPETYNYHKNQYEKLLSQI